MSDTELKKEKDKKGLITGTGRRKTAVARVFLWDKKGEITINGKAPEEYFTSEKDLLKWNKPFHAIGISHPKSKFTASIKVYGSGPAAQISAIVHGVSRALAEYSEEFQLLLSKQGLLTRDPRMVERKKYNLHKARRAYQYSKR